ncbi:benzoylformate decarboxylase [Altericroceibacterium endophyticum]|uniref:Benzoylformate decarboxylase n=1 Tax=Altericroceibacterium endophyticum TaxID=1808508 RepID=A0A6I4T4W1_9SPHN|nr:benzoylformate decarboxylase [Altericroceibacterium endophyticum]MXO65181.1 benzoylformate decarboxylase [Altericroceibacterium endophyticum]
MTNVREAAFAIFQHYGVDRLFGNPGSTELPMLKAMPEGFDYVLGLNEAVVAGMADGFARSSGKPALINLHSSAGTGHALGNLFTAFRNNAPIVVTAGQQARSILPYDPFLFAERPTEFPQPYVKWACEPARAEDVPQALARAFAIALTPPMGPVFVSIPVDDWERECEMPSLPHLSLRTLPDMHGISLLADLFETARNPALVLGTGSANGGGWDAAIELAERSGAAVWVAPFVAREVFPEDHPQFAGFLPAMREDIVKLLSDHDAILVAGAPVFTYHVEGKGPHWPERARLGMLSDNEQHLASLPGNAVGVLGNVGTGLAAISEKVRDRDFTGKQRQLDTPEAEMTDRYVLSRVAALRPDNAVIVEEAPTARTPMHDNLPITREGGFYTCASGGLGYGLPAALGVAQGQSEPVIAVLGDGAAMYTIQGLYTAHLSGKPTSFVILNNSRYAALQGFAAHFGMNSVPGTDLTGIDFVQLAAAQGIPARMADNVTDLDEVLQWTFAQDGPSLVDLRIK